MLSVASFFSVFGIQTSFNGKASCTGIRNENFCPSRTRLVLLSGEEKSGVVGLLVDVGSRSKLYVLWVTGVPCARKVTHGLRGVGLGYGPFKESEKYFKARRLSQHQNSE